MPRLSVRAAWLRTVASQLGNPSGPLGPVVARVLNKANRKPIEAAVSELRLDGGETVADIGFGGGIGLDLLLSTLTDGGRVHGVERSASMVARARKAHPADVASERLGLHQATMEGLPFADGELDGWISLNTIYFIADIEPAVRELRRVLAAKGCGVLGVADPDWLARQPFAEHGFTVRPIEDVVATLEGAGFVVERQPVADSRSPEPYNLLVCHPKN